MARNNLPLGMQFRTCEKFWESADSSPALSQNFSQTQKPHRKSFDCDSQRESPTKETQNAESTLDSANSQNLGENSTRVAESSADSANQANNPKFRSIIVGASGLSLGISIVVAILLGVGAGILMQRIFNVTWVLFLGVFWGIAAAVLNVYKVYKAELRDFDKLANESKYKY